MHQLGALWRCIPLLLYAFWSSSAGAAVAALLPLEVLTAFREAVVLSSKRGKTWDEQHQRWLGPLSSVTVPQAWFRHFYNLGVIVVAVVLATYLKTPGLPQDTDSSLQQYGETLLALLLLSVHLVRRCLESNFMAKYPPGARMHVIAYLFGLLYYTALPLTCLPRSFYEARAQGREVLSIRPPSMLTAIAASSPFLSFTGSAVFLAGNILQYQSHTILADLQSVGQRRGKGKKESTFHYQIPRGGAFELVSCPHYLAEIVIYLGLALLSARNGTIAWLPFIWVVANLMLAAVPTHAWYKRTFEDYPASRRALIPFSY